MKSPDEWLQDLKDPDPDTRLAAVHALSELHNPIVAEAMLQALSDEHHRVRAAAAINLGWMGQAAALEPLVDMLCELPQPEWDTEVNPASAACFALALIAVAEPVLDLLQADNEHIRSLAIVTLRYIGDPKTIPAIREVAEHDLVVWVRDLAAETLAAFARDDFQPLRDTL